MMGRGMVVRAVAGMAVLASALGAAGQEGRVEGPAGAPVPVAEVSLASLDRMDAAMKRGGFDGYRQVMVRMLEGLPFVGPNGLDTTRPLAMNFLGGDNVPAQAMGSFMLPVRPAVAKLDALVAQGFTRVAGREDMVTAPNGFGLRRTQNYVLAGASVEAIVRPTEDALVAQYKDDATVLARGQIDLKALRAAAPAKWAGFIEGIERQNAGNPAQLAGVNLVTDSIRALDSMALSVHATEQTLGMRVVASPVELKATGAMKLAKPGFPEECFARADYAYPSNDARAAIGPGVISFWEKISKDQPRAADAATVKAMTDAITSLLLGDEISVAVADSADGVVVYAVIQHADERGVDERLGEVEKVGTKIAGGKPPKWKKSRYDDGGLRVTRLGFEEGGKAQGYLDLASRGTTTYAAFGPTDAKRVARLAELKPAGETGGPFSAAVDLHGLHKALAAHGMLPPEGQRMPADMFKSGRMLLDVVSDGKGLTVEFKVPIAVLGHVMKMTPLQ